MPVKFYSTFPTNGTKEVPRCEGRDWHYCLSMYSLSM
jgi:hypothetical protein